MLLFSTGNTFENTFTTWHNFGPCLLLHNSCWFSNNSNSSWSKLWNCFVLPPVTGLIGKQFGLPIKVADAIKSNTAMNVISVPNYFTGPLASPVLPPPLFMLWHFLSSENILSLSLAINCLNSIIRKQLEGDREKLTLRLTLKAKWVSMPLWVQCVFENL